MNRGKIKKIALTLTVVLTVGCGAPLKRAGDVSSLFSKAPASIENIAESICAALGERDVAPTTKDMPQELVGCSEAGLKASDLTKVKSFSFTNLASGESAQDQKNSDTFKKSIRTQIWLNRKIPELLPVATQLLKSVDFDAEEIQLPESAIKDLSGLVQPKIKFLEKLKFNFDELSFSTKLNVVTTGAVAVDIDVLVDGKVFNNGIAVTISTGKPEPAFEKSFIKSFDVVFLAIPYANDIYLDMAVNMNIYNIGVSSVIDSQVNSLFGTALKTMMDTITQTERKS
ncbi:MAG: hypothetical protein FJ146_06410 [Deltaproteobacteria bacterium]|nr:hypothetical protein [Deltaproteobacteria bacterium]